MKTLLNRILFGLAFAISSSTFVVAQNLEIEIVNPNGDKVGPQVVAPVQSDEDLIDDDVTIISPDGSSQPLPFTGGQSVIISRSMKTVNENGQQRTESSGKAIIIGPDGKRQEIELDGDSDFSGLGLDGFLGRGTAVKAGKFMIGVHCEPIHPAVAAQLDLEKGLMIKQIASDSPASKAGLQKHDVLLFANDKQLANTADLTQAVQKTGESKSALSLTLIRRGKETTVEVRPTERPPSAIGQDLFPNDMNFQFRQFGPGAVIGGDLDASFQQQMEQMRDRMRQMEQRIQQRMQDFQLQQNFEPQPSADIDDQ
jgi:hypothetical protein